MKKTPETKDQQAIDAAKEKRRSYARAYYAAHKDKLKDAVRRCRAKKAAAKKAAAKHAIAPSKKAAKRVLKPTPAQKQLAKIQKQLAKAQAKYAAAKSAVAIVKAQIKEWKAQVKAQKVKKA